MIEIRANDTEVEISGTVEELHDVSSTISAFLASIELAITLSASPVDPSPYSRALVAMTIERSEGKTLVSATPSQVSVRGSESSLAKFASWFEFPPDVRPGYHAHFEPFPDDPDHSSESIPLVVLVRHSGA